MTSTDVTTAFLTLLQAQTALTDITGPRIWADCDTPPVDYKPANGPGICFKVRGGSDGNPPVLVHPSFQLKIYAIDEPTARGTAIALHDAINEISSAHFLTVYRETMPVTLKEPNQESNVEWTYTLTFYKAMVRNLN